MSRRDTAALDIAVHLIISAGLSAVVYWLVGTVADDPVPALVALAFFAAYWGVFLYVDGDGHSGGGGSSSGFLDSLF